MWLSIEQLVQPVSHVRLYNYVKGRGDTAFSVYSQNYRLLQGSVAFCAITDAIRQATTRQ